MTRGTMTPAGGQKPRHAGVVDRFAVDREVDRQPQPPVGPR